MSTIQTLDRYPFQEKEQSILFHKLTHELRCTVCQNQSLAESDAMIAVDLRNEIYRQVCQKHTEPQIIEYVTARYGDFVLYQPPFTSTTVFLWTGPLLFLVLGFIIFFKMIKKQSKTVC